MRCQFLIITSSPYVKTGKPPCQVHIELVKLLALQMYQSGYHFLGSVRTTVFETKEKFS